MIPWLAGAYVVADQLAEARGFPIELPFVKNLDLKFDRRPTLFVGENGSGKSTVLEALAELVGLPWDGGGATEIADSEDSQTPRLSGVMRPRIRNRPKNKYFFRAEGVTDFQRLLEARKADPDFLGDPYARYGGKSLRTRSHGEGIRQLFEANDRPGLYLFDEPESGLSPAAQIRLLNRIQERAATNEFQFIIATHSPVLQ